MRWGSGEERVMMLHSEGGQFGGLMTVYIILQEGKYCIESTRGYFPRLG